MAITAITNTSRAGFVVNAQTADLSGCEELFAAPSSGRIVVDKIVINGGASITVNVGEGETTGAVTTTRLGPFNMIEGSSVSLDFPGGLYLSATTALTADSSGAGAVCFVVVGRVVD